ncbi:sortase [Cryobacterium frigoriphilum]|uniref:Sortase n=1 Tax=Cryobacterium frigoriphilum TaxID=1259150 RepID=A0A4R9A0E5_9MICO|nr:sortase [Cryobacterium frigoriphilum]TFD49811.1 sortase [Cryobacterium frigoriphilum]
MARKTFAVIALAILAVFAVPAAANAAGYVPAGNVSVSGDAVPGGTVTVTFAAGSFTPGEDVSFACTGSGTATLSAFKAATVTLVKTASAAGAASVNVTLPANATGTYTVTATGLSSGTVGTAAITVTAIDAGTGAVNNTGGGLASTGYDAPVLLIWGAGGALLLGIALVVVLTMVRRQRATA